MINLDQKPIEIATGFTYQQNYLLLYRTR